MQVLPRDRLIGPFRRAIRDLDPPGFFTPFLKVIAIARSDDSRGNGFVPTSIEFALDLILFHGFEMVGPGMRIPLKYLVQELQRVGVRILRTRGN